MMNEKTYASIMRRRRLIKRLFYMLIAFIVSFYISSFLFGDLKVPRVMHLTDLSSCPACYGVTVCPELYSNQIIAESGNRWTNMLFNAKNIYYGYTKSNRKVVLKKLAHNWELKKLDAELCKTWGLKRNCKPIDLVKVSQTTVRDKILKLVRYNLTVPEIEARKGLVMCPFADSIFDFIKPVVNAQPSMGNSEMINIWTMLSVNPEPIILQIIPKSKGWPVPAYGGVCGRLEVVAHEGVPLSSLDNLTWLRKLKLAKKILDAAMDFTFKHDRYRFYLMDWSLDNIVVNDKDDIAFIDMEDVIVLDKQIVPKNNLTNWYKRHFRDDTDDDFTFSIDKICKHHLSDHNLYGACYILFGDVNPFLRPMPEDVHPSIFLELKACLQGGDRFQSATYLQHTIYDFLNTNHDHGGSGPIM